MTPVSPFPQPRPIDPERVAKSITGATLTDVLSEINLQGWLAAARLIQNDEKREEALKQLEQEVGLSL